MRIDISKFEKVVGWGTGTMFRALQRQCPVKLDYIIDRDSAKWGTALCGYPIVGPNILFQEQSDTLVLVYSSSYQSIIAEIGENNTNVKAVYAFALDDYTAENPLDPRYATQSHHPSGDGFILIMPSHLQHFQEAADSVASFDAHCIDKENFQLKVVVSSHEVQKFKEIQRQFPKLRVDVIAFADILSYYGIFESEGELLRRLGKYNFQALKKLYGARYFEHDCCLIVDSETFAIRDFSVRDLFSQYLRTKYIFYSCFIPHPMGLDVTVNTLNVLQRNNIMHHWLFEYQSWFIEKNVIIDLFSYLEIKHRKSVYEIFLHSGNIFEMVLVYWFIYFQNRYGYQFVCLEELLERHLGDTDYELYYRNARKQHDTSLFEYHSYLLTQSNIRGITQIYESYSLAFFRPVSAENWGTQKEFVEQNPYIKILPCFDTYKDLINDIIPTTSK